MSRITEQVTVASIIEFARENLHMGTDRYGDAIWEKFVAITMVTADGRALKNFTKFDREFARSVSVGLSFDLSYVVKEEGRECPDSGVTYDAVVYCQQGVTKAELAAQRKAERKAKRDAKLGL